MDDPLDEALRDPDPTALLGLVRDGAIGLDDAFAAVLSGADDPSTDAVKALLAAGADVNRPLGARGAFPVFIAALNGEVGLYRILRLAGAKVRAVDSTGASLLHCAVRGRRVDLIADALACGGDPNLLDAEGETPLTLALRRSPGDTPAQAEAKARKIIETLLAFGAKPGADVLRRAAAEGFTSVLSRLRETAGAAASVEAKPVEKKRKESGRRRAPSERRKKRRR